MISLIAVIGRNRELGKDNKLLWHIPGDLPRFKAITTGHPIIMGRKTFTSIGTPLANRTNIVISTDSTLHIDQCIVVASLTEALHKAKESPGADEIFIIGGGQIFSQAISLADRLYLTVVDASSEADTFFPDYQHFTSIISQEHHQQGGYSYTYLTLEK